MADAGSLNKRIEFEQRRRGFRLFSAAREFVRGWDAYHVKDFRTALDSFKRVTVLDPDNPYGHAYLLFMLEDIGGYTNQQLADVSARWSDAAIKYKYQAQDALSMAYLTHYVKNLEQAESGDLVE